jgi:predicted homoserine dehydrogenase-like protein
MYQHIYNQLAQRERPIDVIVSGLGFMGFGFIDGSQTIPNLRIALVISRRPQESREFLIKHGYKAEVVDSVKEVDTNKEKGIISVSSNLDLVRDLDNEILLEVTGTVEYGTDVVLKAIEGGKHILTMNPELQVTVGSQLKKIADKKGLLISDVYGDQPGSLSRLIMNARMMGYKVLVAGNMKRYRDNYATQEKMLPWAKDKGLAVRQTVSFTDGTKQAIEMNLVSNYFRMDILQEGMKGAKIADIKEAITAFDGHDFGKNGVVDYGLGINLFPGVFALVEHTSKNQQKYLRYLGLGDGPRYALFEPYHLCHLEVGISIAEMILFKQPIINNSTDPIMRTVTYAKRDLKKGEVLDGIGGDTIRGDICRESESKEYLPAGLAMGAVLKNDIAKDQKIKLEDVELKKNKATELFLHDSLS